MNRRRFRVVSHIGDEMILEEYTDPKDEQRRQERAEEARYQRDEAETKRKEQERREREWRDYFNGNAYANDWANSFGRSWSHAYGSTSSTSKKTADYKAIYKKLAKKYHPDLGGSTSAMQALNGIAQDLERPFSTLDGVIRSARHRYASDLKALSAIGEFEKEAKG